MFLARIQEQIERNGPFPNMNIQESVEFYAFEGNYVRFRDQVNRIVRLNSSQDSNLPYIGPLGGVTILDQSVIDSINQKMDLKIGVIRTILERRWNNYYTPVDILKQVDTNTLNQLRILLQTQANPELLEFLPYIHLYTLFYSGVQNHYATVGEIKHSLETYDWETSQASFFSNINWSKFLQRSCLLIGGSTLTYLGSPVCASLFVNVVKVIFTTINDEDL